MPLPTSPATPTIAAAADGRPAAREAVRGGALDALRLLAALLIVLYHFGAEGPMRLERFHPVFARGFLATDFFLMLSGYVLGRAYGSSALSRRITPLRFWLRRAGRVWPAHLIVLAAMAAMVLILNLAGTDVHKPSRFLWQDLPLQALLMHAWGFASDGWNLPSWSLSALIVCYALFPFLWRAASRLRQPWLAPLIGLVVVAASDAACRRLFAFGLSDLPLKVGVLRALPLFILGLCLARTVELRWPSEDAARLLMVVGGVVLVGLQIAGRHDLPSLMAIAAVILGAGRLPVKQPSALMEAGAKLSFALFITHIFVGVIYWSAVHRLIEIVPIDIRLQWLMWAASFPIAIAAAWLFHTYVDQPLQDRLAPWLRGKPPGHGRTEGPAA